MTCSLFLSTDNGFIVKRTSAGVYSQKYTTGGAGTWEADDLYALLVNPTDAKKDFCVNWRIAIAPNRFPVLSDNLGNTWVDHPANPVRHFARQIVSALDNNGNFYNFQNFIPTNDNIYVSIDRGLNWTSIYDIGTVALNIRSIIVCNGYIWYRYQPFGPSNTDLQRINLDGTGHTSFTTPFPITNQGMSGRLVIPRNITRFYVGPFNTAVNYVFSVDVSNPAVPVFTQSASATPFGAGRVPIWIEPITDQIAIAYVEDITTAFFTGAIYRTTDAGSTWTQVVAPTADLQTRNPATSTTSLAPMTNNNVVSDGQTVFVAGAVPYVFVSLDQGVTWAKETCNVNVSPDAGFHNWDSLTIICGKTTVPVSTVVGAT